MQSKFILAVLAGAACLTTAAGSRAADGPSAAPLSAPASGVGLSWGPCPPIFTAGCEIAVLHGDPSQTNADVFLRVPSGYVLPRHSHTSAERMVLVTGRLRVKYQGHAAAILERGSYAYGPAGLPHGGACLSAEPCTLFIAFETAVDALAFAGPLE